MEITANVLEIQLLPKQVLMDEIDHFEVQKIKDEFLQVQTSLREKLETIQKENEELKLKLEAF